MKNFLKIERLSLTISDNIILDEIDLQVSPFQGRDYREKWFWKSLFAYSRIKF